MEQRVGFDFTHADPSEARGGMYRYAWTNVGPVILGNGRFYNTGHCRKWLAERGVQVNSWARNWMPFVGHSGLGLSMDALF